MIRTETEYSVTGEHDDIDEFVVPPLYYDQNNPKRFRKMYAFLRLTRLGMTIDHPDWHRHSQKLQDEAEQLMIDIRTIETVEDIGVMHGE